MSRAALVKLSRDKKYYEILIHDTLTPDGYCQFILTVNQKKWLENFIQQNVALWRNSANKKFQIALCRKAFMFEGKQIPKNAIIVFDRSDMIWICSSFAFTVKKDKDGNRRRCMIPKKYLKYMHLSCYDMQTGIWSDTTIGRGSLMFNIHDAISAIGVNHVEYDKSLYKMTDSQYEHMMKDCIRRKKSDCGGRAWDNAYAIIGDRVYRGFTDESHWTGMVGSRVAHYARYA